MRRKFLYPIAVCGLTVIGGFLAFIGVITMLATEGCSVACDHIDEALQRIKVR